MLFCGCDNGAAGGREYTQVNDGETHALWHDNTVSPSKILTRVVRQDNNVSPSKTPSCVTWHDNIHYV